MSMGVASLRTEQVGGGADQFIARADVALYRAKDRGRNRIEVGDEVTI
jgi:PleD family two-component response regulator